MFFGAVPLAEAEGAVLAHSVALPGRRLRKGASLTARDIQELAKAGLREVVVAKLGAGDVGEDIAATRLAQAMTKGAQGVTVTKAFTGRVNIVADAPGVALIDAKVVTAVNSCDPMITCATVPPLARLDKGSLIATIKIISYGVAAEDLARSEVAVAQANPAVGLHATKLKSACLIVTLTDAAPSSDKGVAAMKGRLEALGMSLGTVVEVPHRSEAIAASIKHMQEELCLVLTASATSDAQDIAPEGVRLAGGQVTRFGMPVDPGNLLFLGDYVGKPVIGLPGCARSPALNGADFVLERVACGLEVTSADIAQMGVGGLLKEIPQRPQPRRGPFQFE